MKVAIMFFHSDRMKNSGGVMIRQIGNKSMIGIDEDIKDKIDELVSITPKINCSKS